MLLVDRIRKADYMGFGHTLARKKADDRKGLTVTDSLPIRRIKYSMDAKVKAVPTKEKDSFRSSALPYCPILALEAKRKNLAHIHTKAFAWKDKYYLKIGTVVHEIWQEIFTNAALDENISVEVKPFGAWKCSHCHKELTPRFLPKYICDCNNDRDYTEDEFISLRKLQHCYDDNTVKEYEDMGPTPFWLYVELGFEFNGLTGHVDFVEYYPDTDYWVVYDLKTATLQVVKSPDKQLPVVKNVFQIEAYCVILPQVFKEITHIDEYILLYQSRDSATQYYPYSVKWTDDKLDRAEKRLTRWCNGNKFVNEYMQEKRHDPEIFLDIVDTRPCYSDSSYEREMSHQFTYENPGYCPYKRICTTCEGSILGKKLHGAIEENLHTHVNRRTKNG